MKGLIFTEFLEMVEEQFSLQMVDQIINDANLPSGGAYTAVGTYPHHEMVQLVVTLSEKTTIPLPILLSTFGERLFARFAIRYARLVTKANSSFDFLGQLEAHVHTEVKKLYPEAELPRFECTQLADGRMQMIYLSKRAMADLAHGLMIGCFRHFHEQVQIEREDLSAGAGTTVRFVLTTLA